MKLLLKIISLSILVSILPASCTDDYGKDSSEFKQDMRNFVQGISLYAKSIDTNFIIIPQNGQELVTDNGDTDGDAVLEYLQAIDGVGREDLYYGYNRDNKETPQKEIEYMTVFLDLCEDYGVEVLTTDYCRDVSKMEDSYAKNNQKGYISFAAPDRELNLIPQSPSKPYNENKADIHSLSDARNFLYLLNPENFSDKKDFITSIRATNYDLIIMDMFFDDEEFTAAEINQLKQKQNGGERLVISYMSIGEAEEYRYYWNSNWKEGNPSWIEKENPNWEGNFKVRYWKPEWQNIIYGSEKAYLNKILNAGFDGVYLDIIDAFEYFE
ncbi:MAG: endo alpha-1,4 polygalactosaminidase [Bacteroidales bacterium]|nr:endo alpha-1,4 polygalactosaminidase [Bacteroidales bacterium]MBN2817900.1 endo alpha-1,4 polygalactosaminidase [Bacteroidales bacterium]